MLSPNEINSIATELDIQLTKQCESNWQLWRDSILITNNAHIIPEGLQDTLSLWLSNQKHLFFRDYKKKLVERVKQTITQPQKPVTQSQTRTIVMGNDRATITITNENLEKLKERTYLEAYYLNDKCIRRAAQELGIPKSTYHDWCKRNEHLFESEERQSQQ